MARTINTISKNFPKLIQYFENIDDANYSINSKKKVNVLCPCCNKVHVVPIRTIASRGNTYCDFCNDGYSYPERLMIAILDMLNIPYDYQFSPKWVGKKRYDFCIYDKYIIELDGELGHGRKSFNDKSTKQSIESDKYKDKMAYIHGYKVIRIDCGYMNTNRLEYVKNNIINSELSHIININEIDWEQCNEQALSSKIKEVIDVYLNKTPYIDEIANIVNISARTVKYYLINCRNQGLIPNEKILQSNPFKDISIPVIYNMNYLGGKNRMVYCYEDALLFGTIQDANDYYHYKSLGIRAIMNSANKYFCGRHFAYYDELPKDFNFKPYFFSDDDYKEHMYCRLSADGKELLSIYKSKQELPLEYKYLSVYRAVTSKYDYAYGYKWCYLPKQLEFGILNDEERVKSFFFSNLE